MRISVFNSKELQGTILLVRNSPREVAKEIRQRTKAVVGPAWQEAINAATRTRVQQLVIADTARVSVSDQNVTLSAGSVGRALSGGAKPVELIVGAEFGSNRYKQFGVRVSKGKVFYPAVATVIPRIAALWIATTVRTFYEILERGR